MYDAILFLKTKYASHAYRSKNSIRKNKSHFFVILLEVRNEKNVSSAAAKN